MFKKRVRESDNVEISISREVLESIYNECDKYDIDETGGRLIGYYEHHPSKLSIEVCGMIGPGPHARRSPTSFFQDGAYQEKVFRNIEEDNSKIEHLGNWHTHHVNGLQTLSSGDIETYRKTVNHEKQNTDFFYALLVVARTESSHSGERYAVKHFLFRRGENSAFEVPASRVRIVRTRAVFVERDEAAEEKTAGDALLDRSSTLNEIRVRNKEIMQGLYPAMSPFFSKGAESVYWKGKLTLIDDSLVDVLLLESVTRLIPSYSITAAGSSAERFQSSRRYLKRNFDSAWKAMFSFERDLNRETFETLKKVRRSKSEEER